jgi:hypothetical protein
MRSPDQAMLREALLRLASEPASQAGYLRQLGSWPSLDELALELDDVADAGRRELPAEPRRVLDELDALLDSMSAEPALWDGGALDTAPEWQRVRELARHALTALGAPPVSPRR